jgi:hypothetical protein
VLDLALDNDDKVFFSECSASGDGKIHRVRPAIGGATAKAELACTVRGKDVGPWAGDFAFGLTSEGGLDVDVLYLSSGNIVPSSIFRMTRKDGEWGKPERVFQATMRISGLVMTGPREIHFVSGTQVFRLTDWKNTKAVLTLPGVSLRDLAIVPTAEGAGH